MSDTSPKWVPPEWGPYQVAIKSGFYEARTHEIEFFFGRTIAKYSHYLVHDHQTYAVFCFPREDDAQKFAEAFDGEPFDPRDKGSGSNWMKWYKGRTAKKKRVPYNFR